jgi:hypothetical protein
MPVTPTGTLAVPLHTLRGMIAASPAWRLWTGDATGAGVALTDSYLVACPPRIPRPHAIIDLDRSAFSRTRDQATVGRFVHQGGLLLYIGAPVANGTSDLDAMTAFLNRIDAVMADLENTAPAGGVGLILNGYTLADGPARMPATERDKNGDIIEALFAIDVTVWP